MVAGEDDKFCETAEIVAEVPAQWRLHPGYMHSFAITPNYIVMIESPMCISVFKILTAHLRGKTMAEALEFYPEYPVSHISLGAPSQSGEAITVGIAH